MMEMVHSLDVIPPSLKPLPYPIKGTLFLYKFICPQESNVLERLTLMLIRLQFDVLDGEIKVYGECGSGFLTIESHCPYTGEELAKFRHESLNALALCFDDISKWPAKEAVRPAVDPDLISVIQLQEMEGLKNTTVGDKVYNLDVFGINQAGLLGYLCSLICQSGFEIVYTEFHCVARTKPAQRARIHNGRGRVRPDAFNLPAYTGVLPRDNSSDRILSSNNNVTPPLSTTRSTGSPHGQFTPRRCGSFDESNGVLPTKSPSTRSLPSEVDKADKEEGKKLDHAATGSARLKFHIRPKAGVCHSLHPIKTLRQVLEFPEQQKTRKKCYLLNRPVHRRTSLSGRLPDENWLVPKGPMVETSFSNGDVYLGELRDNSREGFGIYKYGNSSMPDARKKYEGQWVGNTKHGYGIAYWANGDAYAGEWVNNKRSGFGVMMKTARDNNPCTRLEGEWLDDLPDGLGVEEKNDSAYFGTFAQGRRSGRGLEVKLQEHKYEVVVREGRSDTDEDSTPKTSRAHLFDALGQYNHPIDATGSTDLGSGSSSSTRILESAHVTPNSNNSLASRAPELLKGAQLGHLMSILGISSAAQALVSKDGINGEDLLNLANEPCRKRFLMRDVEILVVKKCLRLLSNNHRVEWSLSALNTHATVNLPEVDINSVLNRHLIEWGEVKKVRKISAGGFGTVHEGYWAKEGKVALKEMRSECTTLNLAELLKEATVSAALNHENICKFLGVSQCPPHGRFIVYEFLPWSLFDLIHTPRALFDERPKLNAHTRFRLAEHISRGVSYMHSLGVIHADLKSPNVLVSRGSRGQKSSVTAKLCDFGHAAVRPLPRPHTRLGTPHWAAPEALRGEGISYPCDVWAFGVICWEMLTFKVPFAGLSAGAVIAAVGWGGKTPEDAEKCVCELGQLASECIKPNVADRPLITDCVSRLRKIRQLKFAKSVGCMVLEWFETN